MAVNDLQSDELLHNKQLSVFAYTEPDLTSDPGYLGLVMLDSLSQSLGTPNPIRINDPARAGKTKLIGYTFPQDELATVSINEQFHRYAATYLMEQRRTKCPQVWLAKIDSCGRRDDLESWESVLLLEDLTMTNIELSDLGGDDDTVVTVAGEFTIAEWYQVFPARFAERGADAILSEVLDLVYADKVSCGNCTAFSDGTQKLYGLTSANAGSPGLSSQLLHSSDGGSTVSAEDIATLSGQSARRMSAVGNRMVVVSEADGAHHYKKIDDIGDSSVSWIRVSSGYVAGGAPRAIYAANPINVFIGGAGGYIYRSKQITSSVEVIEDNSSSPENVNDIHGVGTGIIVSVHDSNVVKYSINGETFELLSTDAGLNGPENGANLTAVWVFSRNSWLIGTNTGKLWRTGDQGKTFTQVNLPNQGNITVINRIAFTPNRQAHGALVAEVSGAGKVLRSITGGRQWYDSDPAVGGVVSNDRLNAIALADVYAMATGGLNGSDGILLVAEAT